jgi:hypothetical protein
MSIRVYVSSLVSVLIQSLVSKRERERERERERLCCICCRMGRRGDREIQFVVPSEHHKEAKD